MHASQGADPLGARHLADGRRCPLHVPLRGLAVLHRTEQYVPEHPTPRPRSPRCDLAFQVAALLQFEVLLEHAHAHSATPNAQRALNQSMRANSQQAVGRPPCPLGENVGMSAQPRCVAHQEQLNAAQEIEIWAAVRSVVRHRHPVVRQAPLERSQVSVSRLEHSSARSQTNH